jgi:HAD superfamily hydrolase (TIGR01509 family)
MNLDKFEWIFFDIGGVLFDDSITENLRRKTDLLVLKEFIPKISEEEVNNNWKIASGINGNIDENLMRIFLKDDSACQNAILKLQERKKTWPFYEERSIFRPESVDILKKLSKKHKLGVIANQPGQVKEILSKNGISEYFNFLGISDEYNLHKPDLLFFEKVLKDSGADPLKSVMIDDNIERGLLPAKKLGFTTIWFDNNIPNNSDDKIIDYKINLLKELI